MSVPALQLQILPLRDGDRLDLETFHARYEAMPPGTRAELIDGVVYMASPTSADHGGPHLHLGGWIFHYEAFTPGVRGLDNVTTRLSGESEIQPDVSLVIASSVPGSAQFDARGYLVTPPSLVVEVAVSSSDYDLKIKRRLYERDGVGEYIVVVESHRTVRLFVRRSGRLVEVQPGADRVFRSEIFPGLWLDVDAVLRRDAAGILSTLQRGIETPEHSAFVERLRGE